MKIFTGANKKRNILIGVVLLLIILSQLFMVKLIYAHKISGSPAKFLATLYQLKAGIVEDKSGDINIYLKDFITNKNFVSRLLDYQVNTDANFANLDIKEQEISDLVWNNLLKKAWLKKIAKENDIELTQEDIDYYINLVGGQDKLKEMVETQGISLDEYKYFLIEQDILEAKVYDYLIATFKDQEGVAKIQEAYAFLEAENGKNWDDAVKKYTEDTRLSDNSFWLSEDELINEYEAIKEIEEVGGFSKIVQSPIGYVIWHLDSISNSDEKNTREIRGLLIYAKSIDDFLADYLSSVNIKRKY
ncbi:MAG: hypothetical protein WCS88_03450 [Patescibacteria group bacterium]|jgi:hypothetical protein